jgi:hypothetical protein
MKINLTEDGVNFFKTSRPNVGDVRCITFPALFPIVIGTEERWLKIVKIQQVCVRTYETPQDPFDCEWLDYRFLEVKTWWQKFLDFGDKLIQNIFANG